MICFWRLVLICLGLTDILGVSGTSRLIRDALRDNSGDISRLFLLFQDIRAKSGFGSRLLFIDC